MKFRFGIFALFALAVTLGGCGAGTAGDPGNGLVPQDMEGMGEDSPDWVEDLPEGTPPEDNEYTGQTAFFLAQAMNAQDEEAAVRFYEQALETAREGIAEFPDNAEHYYHAGEALFGLGELQEGARMFDRAEELYPRILAETMATREIAWAEELNEGFEIQEAGDFEGALAKFESAHGVYQYRPEAMLNLGSAYSQLGRYDDAIEMFGEAIDVITGPWGERMGDEETRATWADQLEIAMVSRAQLLLMQERFDEASDAFEALLERDDDNLEALSGYGASLVGAGRMEEAEALFDELLNRPGLNAADYYSIGVGLYQADSFEQAALAFSEAYELVPEHRDVIYNLAQSLYLADQFEELLPVAERLVEIDPLNHNAYSFLGTALIRVEREQEGIAVLEDRDALDYVIEGLSLQLAGDALVVAGQLVNRSAAAGSTLDLQINFYDVDGASLGSENVSVEVGPEGEPVVFQVVAPDDPSLFGFRYEIR